MSTTADEAFEGGMTQETEPLSRRRFVQGGLGAMGVLYVGAIAYPVYRFLMSPAEQAAALAAVKAIDLSLDALPEVGTAHTFEFGTKPAVLIHLTDGRLVCFDSTCTHLGCTVQYQPEEGRIFCACHGGVYDQETGKNVAGPPPKPLTQYNVDVSDEAITISRA